MGRKILFVTTDQQRYDALGCNGNTIARTPVIDALAADGIVYRTAYNQNTVCMPARSTMLTGQYVRTHGVVANGIPLPEDAPSIARHLSERAGYKTALVGKAHFDPLFDLGGRFSETRRADAGDTGPWRGFDYSIQALHTAAVVGTDREGNKRVRPLSHYGRWLAAEHPEHLESFASLLTGERGGDTGAPESKDNPIPREWYHTDWVADLTVAWLDSLAPDDDWFCWMSFPDPHHPWDPPASEMYRVPWRDLDLPPGHPGSRQQIEEILSRKPRHWLGYFDGSFENREGGAIDLVPARLTHDQIREVNARTHVMNELVDEALGRVLKRIAERGWAGDTDVIYTTDHGELQGDFGLLFKGPFHTDALMHIPLVWRPAPRLGLRPAEIVEPVGQLDLAPTFCEIAGVPVPGFVEGEPLPTAPGSPREQVLCEWDSQFPGFGMHMRSIRRDRYLCTAYEPSTVGRPTGLEERFGEWALRSCGVEYGGDEGELYDVVEDPLQWRNLWDEPACRSLRDDLVQAIREGLPAGRAEPLKVESPA